MIIGFPGLMLFILLWKKAKKLIVTSSELTLFDPTYYIAAAELDLQ